MNIRGCWARHRRLGLADLGSVRSGSARTPRCGSSRSTAQQGMPPVMQQGLGDAEDVRGPGLRLRQRQRLHDRLAEPLRGYHLTALIKRWITWGRTSRERSPPRTAGDTPCAPPAGVRVTASPADQPDPTAGFSSRPSQPLSIERCDDRLNPPSEPGSEWWINPGEGGRRVRAIPSASSTSSARRSLRIDPANATAAPAVEHAGEEQVAPQLGPYVMSATQRRSGPAA